MFSSVVVRKKILFCHNEFVKVSMHLFVGVKKQAEMLAFHQSDVYQQQKICEKIGHALCFIQEICVQA